MDAADVPNPRRRNHDCRYLGVGDFMPWIATTSILSRPRRGLRKHGERLQASLRKNLAFAVFFMSGYAVGVAIALITGVTIGWFNHARYWGMPLLKVVGPIPATAWIPLAMVVSPSTLFSAIGLIALAVWFPVTMLT